LFGLSYLAEALPPYFGFRGGCFATIIVRLFPGRYLAFVDLFSGRCFVAEIMLAFLRQMLCHRGCFGLFSGKYFVIVAEGSSSRLLLVDALLPWL
jgi:hypothetical protein